MKSIVGVILFGVILISDNVCSITMAQNSGRLTENSKTIFLSPENNTKEIRISPGNITIIELSIIKSSTIEFGIIEVHSYFMDVTLSYNETLISGFFTKGRNMGLVVFGSDQESSSTYVYLTNDNVLNKVVDVLLILQTYDSNAPIPGGCNMEESIQTAPFLPTQFTSSVITVELPLASWPLNVRPSTCDKTPQQYDIYHYYLPENDKALRTAFDAILYMSGVKNAETHGRKIDFNGSPRSKIRLANYKGTGHIVVIVARALTSSAAYVPTLSFGCYPNSNNSDWETIDSCDLLFSVWTKLLVSSLFFVGLFHTLLGHRFYKTHLFIHGFVATSIISYILLILFTEISYTDAELATVALGVFGGSLLVLIWCRFDVPLFAVFLACLLVGFIFSSVVAYTPLADFSIMKNNAEFWLAFSSLVLVIPVVLVSFTHAASIICTALVGSFTSIIILDLYVGSNLKFIIFNIFHRATQNEFQSAVLDPPFQTRDLVLTVVWGLLSLIGIAFQMWREKDRPPFPNRPACFISRPLDRIIVVPESPDPLVAHLTETTPLLHDANRESV